MKKNLLLLILMLIFNTIFAQLDLKKTTFLLQECLNINSNTKGSHIQLYEHNGVLAYQSLGTIQKIKLADLESVAVNKNDAGFSVDIKCPSDVGCITFQKNDTSSQQFQTTAIQFVEAQVANTFLQNMTELINHYKENNEKVKSTLFLNEKGEAPLLKPKQTPVNKPSPKINKKEIDEDDDDETDVESTQEKENTKQKDKRKKEVDPPKNKTNKNNDTDEDEMSVSNKQKNKRNKLIEDNDDDSDNNKKDGKTNDFCNQLLAIIKSGKESNFKTIEGKTTSEDGKINESQIKLKGTKKNYLSWYKKQRAFISEIKSGKDYDLAYKEFDAIQNTLDECLGSSWVTDDLSSIDEYSNLKTEVKDIQFENENDKNSPKIRVIFIEGEKTYTVFIRIQ